MKKLFYLLVLVLAFNFNSFAQTELTLENPTLKIENTVWQLVGFTDFEQPIVKMTEYRENGLVYQTGNYVNGKPDGDWQMYDVLGNIMSEMRYVNGNKETLINYTENGEIVVHYVDNKPYKHIQVAYLQ